MTIYHALDHILNKYTRARYTITDLSADNEFEPILAHLENEDSLNVNLHIVAAQEHVPEAERNHKVMKERIRATYHQLPFDALPRVVMQVLVAEVASKLNYFPSNGGYRLQPEGFVKGIEA